MPKIAPELKQKLLEQGKWSEFVLYRQTLKEGGMVNADAHNQAVEHFFGYLPEVTTERKIIKKSKKPIKQKVSVEPPPPQSADNGKDGGGSESSPGPPPSSPIPAVKDYIGNLPRLVEVKSGDFDGKVASEVEAVRWVADNMEVLDPRPKDCPSAAAWGLLSQCRQSLQARSDFWKLTYAKLLPTKAQMEKEQDALPDESKAKEVIEDLLRFGREARGEKEPEKKDMAEEEAVLEVDIIEADPVEISETATTGFKEFKKGEF
jgi:hypothetical protein